MPVMPVAVAAALGAVCRYGRVGLAAAGLFDALAVAAERGGYRGCGFLNAAAESTPGSKVHARTVAHKRAVRQWIEGLAVDAGADDPAGLARSLTLLLDGALATGALDADPAAPAAARRSAEGLVDASTRHH